MPILAGCVNLTSFRAIWRKAPLCYSAGMRQIQPDAIRPLLPLLDSDRLDKGVLDRAGIFILRRAIPPDVIKELRAAWNSFYSLIASTRKINPRNPAIIYEALPEILAQLYKHPVLLDIVEKVHGPDIALYFHRFLVKDKSHPDALFMHQDFGYNTGWPDKISVFVPMNTIGPENGGMIFYPGTHEYGFLGDIGDLTPEALAPDMPSICPTVEPGDTILMHQFTWHGSGPFHSGPERGLAQVTYQPANDPTGIELLRGSWQVDRVTGPYVNDKIFKRSRIQRLQEMQAQLDKIEGK